MPEVLLSIESRQILISKQGQSLSECQDSIGIRKDVLRYCVADGATETFDPRRWARLLTKSWVRRSEPISSCEDFLLWIKLLGERFRRYWATEELPWFAKIKARDGAYAAFVGLSFNTDGERLTWRVVAIGDSCLIHLRNGQLLKALPIDDPALFRRRPILIPSNNQWQPTAVDNVVLQQGCAYPDDVFILCSDAIAAWYLYAAMATPDVAREFTDALDSNRLDDVHRLIETSRANKTLRNDDIAVISIFIRNVFPCPEQQARGMEGSSDE